MKAVLLLLLIAFAYSIPNPVYVIKDCFEKLYDSKANSILAESVQNDLLKWKIDVFYQKLDAVDPTLKAKIKECEKEVYKKTSLHTLKNQRN